MPEADMAAGGGGGAGTAEVSQMSEDDLVTGIEQTRADLARTIDEITDRLSPANAARRAVDQARERVAQIDPVMAGGAVVVVAGVTVLYLLARGRRRRRGR
jgi:hypothetical protein